MRPPSIKFLCAQIKLIAKAGHHMAIAGSVDHKRIDMLEAELLKLAERIKSLEQDMNTHCHYAGSRGPRIPEDKL